MKTKKYLKIIFFSGLYLLFVFLCLVITDKIYANYEKFPFEHTEVILQRHNPSAFRLSNTPGLLYEMRPNLKNNLIETNSMGVRAREYSIPKPKNTFRILILGDSVAYGIALAQEDVFSDSLEKKLNSSLGHNKTYEVINVAVPGYNIMQEYISFVNKFYRYEPDLVIDCVNQTDLTPEFLQFEDYRGSSYGYLKKKISKREHNNLVADITPYEALSISMPNIFHLPIFIHRRLILNSSIYRTITINLYDALSRRNKYAYPPRVYLDLVNDQGEYAIKELKFYCKQHSIGLIFALFPMLYDTISPGVYDHVREIKEMLDSNSIAYLDLKPYYKSYTKNLPNLTVCTAKDGCDYLHLNALGHRVTAEAFFDYLAEYLKRSPK
jgi:hypothetical protein